MPVPKYVVISRLTANLHSVDGSINADSDEEALRIFKDGDYPHMWSDVYKLVGELVCRKCQGTGIIHLDLRHNYCDCPKGQSLACLEAMGAGEDEHGL